MQVSLSRYHQFEIQIPGLKFVRHRRDVLANRGVERVGEKQLRAWTEDPVHPDDDAAYVGRITLDLTSVTPHVAGPDSVQVATPLSEIESRGIEIHKAYLVSCVNSRADSTT